VVAHHIDAKTVIAGLDPAMQESAMDTANLARQLDRRVKPGGDIESCLSAHLQSLRFSVTGCLLDWRCDVGS
jgi:hypothetical protein